MQGRIMLFLWLQAQVLVAKVFLLGRQRERLMFLGRSVLLKLLSEVGQFPWGVLSCLWGAKGTARENFFPAAFFIPVYLKQSCAGSKVVIKLPKNTLINCNCLYSLTRLGKRGEHLQVLVFSLNDKVLWIWHSLSAADFWSTNSEGLASSTALAGRCLGQGLVAKFLPFCIRFSLMGMQRRWDWG